MESCPSWPKEHDWKSCRRQKRLEGSNPLLSAMKKAVTSYDVTAFLFAKSYEGIWRTSGTEQQSCGLLWPRATKRPQSRESKPLLSAIKKSDTPFCYVCLFVAVIRNFECLKRKLFVNSSFNLLYWFDFFFL